ncbi:MAG TPA: cell division protein FtsQ/DivIB [Rudaea sp.]
MNSRFLLKSLAWAIALALVLLPVIGVLNGWFAAERWPVKFVEVESEFEHVSAEQIRGAAATRLGPGFFAVKLDDVRAAVAKLPWVEKVEVRKRWPDTVVLRVTELHPIARWGAQPLVSAEGTLFSAPGSDVIQGLPQLDGPDDALDRVLEFFGDSQRAMSGSGLTVSGAVLSARGSWKLVLGNGAEVMIGREQAQARLQRFVAVYPRLASGHEGTVFERADLRYTNGFAIQWPVASTNAPEKPAKPASGKQT